MCSECGCEYGHLDCCPELRAEKLREAARHETENATNAAKTLTRVEVIAELTGWIKARMSYAPGTASAVWAYNDVLYYLESLKTR